MAGDDTVRAVVVEAYEGYRSRVEAALAQDIADTSLLDRLRPKRESSRGTWYPLDERTRAPEWIPGEQRMSYATERECQDAIDRYNERERRRMGV